MRKPTAQTLSTPNTKEKAPAANSPGSNQPGKGTARKPRAFTAEIATPDTPQSENWLEIQTSQIDPQMLNKKRPNWFLRLALATGALLVSLSVALMADRLIADLFARYDWLGWMGLALLGLFVVAMLVLVIREFLALKSLKNLDNLRQQTADALQADTPQRARTILIKLHQLYQTRPDLASARQQLEADLRDELDGSPMLHAAERRLMSPLDIKAKEMTAATARRVAIVTAISPRAIVDIAFVAYESLKLARNIATLYGARPGFFGSWRLAGEILAHLAITGGVALGDSVVQQLLGHGLAAKVSARLGEGLVNGLMSVRVGIAAMRVTRPMPFDRLKQPKVMDFMSDLAKITKSESD